MIVLLDTNFLLAVEQRHLNLGELSFFGTPAVISPVLREVEVLARTKGNAGVAAKVGLEMIKKNKMPVIGAEGRADDALLHVASRKGAAIATLDRELRRRARKNKIPTISIIKGRIALT